MHRGGVDRNYVRQFNIAAACADKDFKLARFDRPVVNENVVKRERALVKGDGNRLCFAGFKINFIKAFQFLFGTENRGFHVFNVNLRNFRAGDFAGVFHVKRNGENVRVGYRVRRHFQVGIFKRRIRQAETEGVAHGFVRAVEVTISYVNAFAILHVFRAHREVCAVDIVVEMFLESFGKFARRVCVAE